MEDDRPVGEGGVKGGQNCEKRLQRLDRLTLIWKPLQGEDWGGGRRGEPRQSTRAGRVVGGLAARQYFQVQSFHIADTAVPLLSEGSAGTPDRTGSLRRSAVAVVSGSCEGAKSPHVPYTDSDTVG
jgi:hypothetical protein